MKKCTWVESRARRNAGFTLIEIMLVVVIIGILAAIAIPNLAGNVGKAQANAAASSIRSIENAVDMYEVDNGKLPDSLTSLVTKGSEINWNGPYIKKADSLKDPWGTEFQYTKRSDREYSVISAGPDKSFGTSDDVK